MPRVHKSNRPKGRLRKPKKTDEHYAANPERIYAAVWLRWMKDKPWFLDRLLDTDVSQRECELIAGVIQWLATNVGQGFIFEAERRVEEARRKAEAVNEERWQERLRKWREDADQAKKKADAEERARRGNKTSTRGYQEFSE